MQEILKEIRLLVQRHNIGYRGRILALLDQLERETQQKRDNLLSVIAEAEFAMTEHDADTVDGETIAAWMQAIREAAG